jgi:hypothetical protein
MNTKYIIANIKIPLMVNDDGTYVVLSENTEIKFSSFEGELKTNEKNDASEELSNLIASLLPIDSVLPSGGNSAKQNNLTAERFGASIVLEEVIENVPSIIRKNITFKRCTKKKSTSKHSIKKSV